MRHFTLAQAWTSFHDGPAPGHVPGEWSQTYRMTGDELTAFLAAWPHREPPGYFLLDDGETVVRPASAKASGDVRQIRPKIACPLVGYLLRSTRRHFESGLWMSLEHAETYPDAPDLTLDPARTVRAHVTLQRQARLHRRTMSEIALYERPLVDLGIIDLRTEAGMEKIRTIEVVE